MKANNFLKSVVILRGVPGSGKSSFVNLLRLCHDDVVIHEIDDLHRDDHGKFLWDEKNAERLYALNFAKFVISCSESRKLIIFDAINIETKNFQCYVDIAEKYDYKVYVVCPSPPTPEESSKNNTHHTSALQARDMYRRWESWPSKEMIKEITNGKNN